MRQYSICVFILIQVTFLIYCNGVFLHRERYPSTFTTSSWFSNINSELQEINQKSAALAWTLMTGGDPNGTLLQEGAALGAARTEWKNSVCDYADGMNFENERENRMYMLLCRGAEYTQDQARELSKLMDNMSEAYFSAEVCVAEDSWPVKGAQIASTEGKVCLKGEPDLEQLMSREDLSAEQYLWVWKSWHDAVGPSIKQFYPLLVSVLNQAAVNNEYKDIGEVWRDELETKNLENLVKKLYQNIEPLYVMLHAVVRHVLVKKYGPEIVDPTGPIPVHLLGNMWAQDWSSLTNLLIPKQQNLYLNDQIANKNWTVKEMVELAEDMYVSLGLPKMSAKFWKYSKFERDNKKTSLCHGTAANMFNTDDYRILLCAKLNMDDFYVIHHEMGHIEYYMAYKNQPTIFQDGTNSAFQESIGDSVMTGVMVPQHLYRLGLLTDEQLLDENLDIKLLLQQALSKIPQIPFALLIDQYRWDIFRGKINPNSYNRVYWNMNKKLRGIIPPEPRSEHYFDVGAKFHVPDNTPYIRYFLSAILQMEMFKGMCELTLFGKVMENSESDIPFPLHRCDIYGSKIAGTKLKKMMSLGASTHWTDCLRILTGKNYITVNPLLEYYKPVYHWLQKYIIVNNVTVGW